MNHPIVSYNILNSQLEENMTEQKRETVRMLGLSKRAQNCLMANNIYWLSDLVSMSRNDLLRVPLVGPKLMMEIMGTLEQQGLSLQSEEDVCRRNGHLVSQFDKKTCIRCGCATPRAK